MSRRAIPPLFIRRVSPIAIFAGIGWANILKKLRSRQNIATAAVIAVIVLWLFGANKLKELARGLGEGAREFKKIKKEIENPESDENQK